MTAVERRAAVSRDRRRVPRGGRRTTDRPGRYPPVLVADSDDGARRPCVRYLQLFGFQVEEARTGDDAVAVIDAVQPQVVVAELTLPSAERLTERLTQDVGIPVIVMATDDASSIQPQAIAVLVKPFPLATMLEEVRRVLRQKAS